MFDNTFRRGVLALLAVLFTVTACGSADPQPDPAPTLPIVTTTGPMSTTIETPDVEPGAAPYTVVYSAIPAPIRQAQYRCITDAWPEYESEFTIAAWPGLPAGYRAQRQQLIRDCVARNPVTYYDVSRQVFEG